MKYEKLLVADEPNQRRDDPVPIRAINGVDGRSGLVGHAEY